MIDAVAEMDLSALYARYREDGRGRAALEPSMMVALLLYAYCLGERSSRRIERHCQEDVAFRVIMGNQVPDHTTIRPLSSGERRGHGHLLAASAAGCTFCSAGEIGTAPPAGSSVSIKQQEPSGRGEDGRGKHSKDERGASLAVNGDSAPAAGEKGKQSKDDRSASLGRTATRGHDTGPVGFDPWPQRSKLSVPGRSLRVPVGAIRLGRAHVAAVKALESSAELGDSPIPFRQLLLGRMKLWLQLSDPGPCGPMSDQCRRLPERIVEPFRRLAERLGDLRQPRRDLRSALLQLHDLSERCANPFGELFLGQADLSTPLAYALIKLSTVDRLGFC